ncbi:MaoC family dehydratase [Deinococcus antarcticus]|uniref:MaoC family dehydratase n=1 Tax=Deinococcus antarcticus TaxID=1298767 RepID=A0ABV8AB35_9DEIO
MSISDLKNRVGQEVALSAWVPVTQERVNAFADATGDHQFIHVDAEKAAQGPFGTTIAHGFLTLSLLAGEFMNQGGLPNLGNARIIVNYGLNKVRFLAPVPVGSRLRNRAVLHSLEEGQGFVQITLQNTIEIDGQDKPACIAETVFRVYL